MFFIVACSILFLLLRLPTLFEPYWYGDEGIYLVLGQAIRKGLVLYSQIHDNKPPLLYYLAALGNTVFGFRLLLLIWMIPTLYFFKRLADKFLKPKIADISFVFFLILTSIPLIEGSIANAEIFMLLPTILAVYLLYTAVNRRNLILSGLLLGLAFSIKIPVVAEVFFLGIWILFFRQRHRYFFKNILSLLPFAISFILPTLLFALYFYTKNALPQFTFAALLQNFGYLSSWSTGSHSGSATQGGLLTRLIILILSFVIIYFFHYKRRLSSDISFILLWFAATIFGTLLSSRPYPHYIIQTLPPLSLLIGFLFTRRYYLFLPVLLFSLIIFKFKFYFYPVFSYYKNFYTYSFKLKTTQDYNRFFGADVNDTYALSQYIKNHTDPGDRIFIWGDQPYIYALSDRLPVGKYTVAYHIVDFNGYNETINSFKAVSPKLIIYYSMSGRDFPQLDNFISRYYSLNDKIGSAFIYKLR